MWVVHQQPCAVYHKAAVCSKATCFSFLIFLVTLVTPFVLVYRSQGLWVREVYQREQPDIRFKHEVLLTLNTLEGPLVWSTFPNFNTLMARHLRVSFLQVTGRVRKIVYFLLWQDFFLSFPNLKIINALGKQSLCISVNS
ncbi:Transmembrane protein 231 [Portunus trituberculatus]|uniref:Transmembrane protein 231 n=1 Tax=Portunus trituberculatus TaxID=210409 RepID=A0A5B7IJV3_PORTR|nr:Transmembrane protein 231 [Portunus trituberculatus]